MPTSLPLPKKKKTNYIQDKLHEDPIQVKLICVSMQLKLTNLEETGDKQEPLDQLLPDYRTKFQHF